MKFVIHGQPISQTRPRFSRRNGRVLTYDPLSRLKKSVRRLICRQLEERFSSEKREIAIEASNLASAEFFFVILSFYMPTPKTSTEAKKTAKLWGLSKHTSKPDLDNLEKFYLDCLTGIIFEDDSKVVKLTSKKSYSNNPRTEICVMGYKRSLGDEVNGILELFGPDQLLEFLKIGWELYDLYGRDEEGDWVEEIVGDDVDEVRLARTAYLLSALAEKTHKPFSKIHRQYPNFYLKAERLANNLEKYKLT